MTSLDQPARSAPKLTKRERKAYVTLSEEQALIGRLWAEKMGFASMTPLDIVKTAAIRCFERDLREATALERLAADLAAKEAAK